MSRVTIVCELAMGGMGTMPTGKMASGNGVASMAWVTKVARATGAAGGTEVANMVSAAGAPGEDVAVGVGEEGAPTPVEEEPVGEGSH